MGYGYALLTSYWTVLVAELLGDKSIYTVASLALRFRTFIVLGGMLIAFAAKMFIAVLLGQTLAQMPVHWLQGLSAMIFFFAAVLIWIKRPKPGYAQPAVTRIWSRAAVIPFASLFFSEWGDPGQISAAALTAKSQLPLIIWLGGTLALVTKGVFAMILGLKLRDRLPQNALRIIATASCCTLGVLALRDALLS